MLTSGLRDGKHDGRIVALGKELSRPHRSAQLVDAQRLDASERRRNSEGPFVLWDGLVGFANDWLGEFCHRIRHFVFKRRWFDGEPIDGWMFAGPMFGLSKMIEVVIVDGAAQRRNVLLFGEARIRVKGCYIRRE